MLTFDGQAEFLPDQELFEDLVLPLCAYCGERGTLEHGFLMTCLCPGSERAKAEELERGRALAREHDAKAREAREVAWTEYRQRRAAEDAKTLAAAQARAA